MTEYSPVDEASAPRGSRAKVFGAVALICVGVTMMFAGASHNGASLSDMSANLRAGVPAMSASMLHVPAPAPILATRNYPPGTLTPQPTPKLQPTRPVPTPVPTPSPSTHYPTICKYSTEHPNNCM